MKEASGSISSSESSLKKSAEIVFAFCLRPKLSAVVLDDQTDKFKKLENTENIEAGFDSFTLIKKIGSRKRNE